MSFLNFEFKITGADPWEPSIQWCLDQGRSSVGMCWCGMTRSQAFLAEISGRSPWKLLMIMIQKNIQDESIQKHI